MPVRWVCVMSVVLWTGCGANLTRAPQGHEDLDATLWMRTSAEFQVLTEETYTQARDQLALALKDPTWSALPDQVNRLHASEGESLPTLTPAVILDVDETVLDNSEYQARLIRAQGEHDSKAYDAWVKESAAPLIPGAKEFIDYCHANHVQVFYITNRGVDVEKYTRQNLEKHGLIDAHAVDNILSKDERVDWTVDKTTRRDYVASRYRVLSLIGDDLNDFLWAGDKPTPKSRKDAALEYEAYWGHKWFLLPNANYGGWERALFQFDDSLPRDRKLQKKLDQLKSETPPPAAE